jgi:hypothetical protein
MDRSSIASRNLRAEQFFGQGIDRLFVPGTGDTRIVPWQSAGHLKDRGQYDNDLVQRTLRRPPQLQDIDPVDLLATQPKIVRHHVEHYLSGDYEKTGKTSEHGDNLGNRFPFIYRREPNPLSPSSGVQNLILAGHHRAAAALVQGKPLRAIVVEGPYGPKNPPR